MDAATRVIVRVLNHLLASAEWARLRLSAHAGRGAQVRCGSVGLLLTVEADGYLRVAEADTPVEVTLLIPASVLPELLAGDTGRVMNAVRLEGNAEFADALGFVFRNLRWDAEEDLSRVVGDIFAHRLMNAARALKDGQARAWRALGGNLSEYFADEQEVLVNRANLGIFNDELRTLRDDIARLDKRTGRLARHVAPASASGGRR